MKLIIILITMISSLSIYAKTSLPQKGIKRNIAADRLDDQIILREHFIAFIKNLPDLNYNKKSITTALIARLYNASSPATSFDHTCWKTEPIVCWLNVVTAREGTVDTYLAIEYHLEKGVPVITTLEEK